jgi:RNA polymerase sigma factor (TIGR02999 family)
VLNRHILIAKKGENMEQSLQKPKEITRMLQEWSGGKQEALDALLPLVYAELHRQASRYLRRERAGHTLQTTALIHEAYLKLIDQREVNWQNRAHFFGIAAQAMRRILVDYAKTRHREKRGGVAENLPLEEAALVVSEERSIDLVALDEALTRLAKFDERQARIVELRYFSGLTIEETAEVLRISPATVKSDWNVAKAWLRYEITRSG